MSHPARCLPQMILPVLMSLVLIGGCATAPPAEISTAAEVNPDSGSAILLLASSRSPTMETRFAALAQALNERAALEPALEPYFAVRRPTTVSGVQLVYGLVDGEFGVRQNPAVESALRREYPDLRWLELGQ